MKPQPIILALAMLFQTSHAQIREWKFCRDGKIGDNFSFKQNGRMDAAFIRMDGTNEAVVLKMMGGENRTVWLTNLCQADLEWIGANQTNVVVEAELDRDLKANLDFSKSANKEVELKRQAEIELKLKNIKRGRLPDLREEISRYEAVVDQFDRDRRSYSAWQPIWGPDAWEYQMTSLNLSSEKLNDMREELRKMKARYASESGSP